MNEIPKVIRLLEMVRDYYTLPANEIEQKYPEMGNPVDCGDFIRPGYYANVKMYLNDYYMNLHGD